MSAALRTTRTHSDAPLIGVTSGCAKPDAARLSSFCKVEGEFYPCIDTEA